MENSDMNTYEWENKNEFFKAQQSQQTKLKPARWKTVSLSSESKCDNVDASL